MSSVQVHSWFTIIQCFFRNQEQLVLEQDLCLVLTSFTLAPGHLWSFFLSDYLLPQCQRDTFGNSKFCSPTLSFKFSLGWTQVIEWKGRQNCGQYLQYAFWFFVSLPKHYSHKLNIYCVILPDNLALVLLVYFTVCLSFCGEIKQSCQQRPFHTNIRTQYNIK